MRLLFSLALMAFAVGFGQSVSAQTTGDLQLSVSAAQGDTPLPYAVVGIASLSIERFTDARGRIVLPALPTGSYVVSIRRLGFAPVQREVTIAEGTVTTLQVKLTQIPQRLDRLTVTAVGGCERPGVPDEATAPEVYALVSLLRENADRYRLLASQYPFLATRLRALGELQDDAILLQSVDSSSLPSPTTSAYRAGRIVRSVGISYSMSIPTILDLADDEFAKHHCFFYGGTSVDSSSRGRETWLRLDVRASNRLNSPDVHGSFFLDSATAQLRRMELELSRPDKLPRLLGSIAGVHAQTTFVEIASGLSVIESICAITQLKPTNSRRGAPTITSQPVELQQILRYRFTRPPPDVDSARVFPEPTWAPGQARPRSSLWCAR